MTDLLDQRIETLQEQHRAESALRDMGFDGEAMLQGARLREGTADTGEQPKSASRHIYRRCRAVSATSQCVPTKRIKKEIWKRPKKGASQPIYHQLNTHTCFSRANKKMARG